jgi:hypothetical protein
MLKLAWCLYRKGHRYLIDKLSAQLPAQAATTHAKASTNCGATASAAPSEAQVWSVACEDAAAPSSSKAAVAPVVLGQVAKRNWQNGCLRVLHRNFQDMDHAPREVQRELSADVDSCIAATESASLGALHRPGCYATSEFQKPLSVSLALSASAQLWPPGKVEATEFQERNF